MHWNFTKHTDGQPTLKTYLESVKLVIEIFRNTLYEKPSNQ